MDYVLWGVAILLFLASGIRWIVLPLAVSWGAWVGFIAGAAAGAAFSNGSLPILLICGFLLAWLAHKVHGLWLAKRFGLF